MANWCLQMIVFWLYTYAHIERCKKFTSFCEFLVVLKHSNILSCVLYAMMLVSEQNGSSSTHILNVCLHGIFCSYTFCIIKHRRPHWTPNHFWTHRTNYFFSNTLSQRTYYHTNNAKLRQHPRRYAITFLLIHSLFCIKTDALKWMVRYAFLGKQWICPLMNPLFLICTFWLISIDFTQTLQSMDIKKLMQLKCTMIHLHKDNRLYAV